MKVAQRELLERLRHHGDDPTLTVPATDFLARASATGVLLDRDDDRTAAQGMVDFWTAVLFRLGADPGHPELARFDPNLEPELPENDCPYLGLDAFGETQSHLFRGRGRVVDRMLEALDRDPFLIVTGPSGSGKSSAVMAGLLPRLRQRSTPHLDSPPALAVAGPVVPGTDPLGTLRCALEAAGWPVPPPGPAGADDAALRRWDEALGDLPRVLIVDQFEEMFTLAGDAVRQAAARILGAYLGSAPARSARRLILTVRTDYREYLPGLESLGDRTRDALFDLTPMTAPELREVIEQPAHAVGLRFEDGVVNRLVEDVLGEPAGLPLLQFTLLELWKRRQRRRITLAAYQETGGGRLALARMAEKTYQELKLPENQDTCRRLLLRLLTPTEGVEVLRKRIPRESLEALGDPRLDSVLQRLIDARLLRVTSAGGRGNTQIEVAHEALIRNWPRLAGWIEEEREALRRRQRLVMAAEDWDRAGRTSEPALRGAALEEARRIETPEAVVVAYLAAATQAERRREVRRFAIPLTAAVLLALLALVLWISNLHATRARIVAEENLHLARTETRRANEATEKADAAKQGLERQERRARAQAIGLHAIYQIKNGLPQRGALLAVEAMRLCDGDPYPVREALQGLYDGSQRLNGIPLPGAHPTFSPDSQWMATCPMDGSILVWPLGSEITKGIPVPIRLIGDPTNQMRACVFGASNRWVAALDGFGGPWLWSLEASPKTAAPIPPRPIEFEDPPGAGGALDELALDDTGHWLLGIGGYGYLALWPLTAENQGQTASPSIVEGNFSGPRLSSDGNWISATQLGSDDQSLWLTKELFAKPDSEPRLRASNLLFSPDSRWLVGTLGNDSGIWALSDLATNRSASFLDRWTNAPAMKAAFSPDSRRLALSPGDGHLELWSLDAKEPRRIYRCPLPLEPEDEPKSIHIPDNRASKRHPTAVEPLFFDPAGRLLWSVEDHWSVVDQTEVSRVSGWVVTDRGSLDYLVTVPKELVSPNGWTWSETVSGVIARRALDPGAGSSPRPGVAAMTPIPIVGFEESPGPLCTSRDGRWIAAGDRIQSRLIFLADPTAHPRRIGTETAGINAVQSGLDLSPDARWISEPGEDNLPRPIPAAGLPPLHGRPPSGGKATFSRDSRWFGRLNGTDSVEAELFRLTPAGTWEGPYSVPSPRRVDATGLTFSHDGSRVAVGADNGVVAIWRLDHPASLGDSPASELKAVSSTVQGISDLRTSPDGRWLVAEAGAHTHLWAWTEVRDGKRDPLQDFEGSFAGPTVSPFSPDGRWLALSERERGLTLHATASFESKPLPAPIVLPESESATLAGFSPDGRWLAGTVPYAGDGFVLIWRLDALSPSLAGPAPATIRLRLPDPKDLPADVRRGSSSSFMELGFSPDNRHLVVRDRGICSIWSLLALADQRAVEPIVLAEESAQSGLAFTADNRQLLLRDDRHELRLWSLHPADLIALVEKHVGRNLTTNEFTRFVDPLGNYRPTFPGLPVPADRTD